MGRRTENRLDDLTLAIKEKQRIGAEKVRFIEIVTPDYIETHNLETHEVTRVYTQDEQDEQTKQTS